MGLYAAGVTLHSPGSPPCGAPWEPDDRTHAYPEGVSQRATTMAAHTLPLVKRLWRLDWIAISVPGGAAAQRPWASECDRFAVDGRAMLKRHDTGSYAAGVTFHSPGSPRSGAPWGTSGKTHTYPEGVSQMAAMMINPTHTVHRCPGRTCGRVDGTRPGTIRSYDVSLDRRCTASSHAREKG